MVPFTVVGASPLGAIKDVLDDAATDEIMGAWGEAYSLLADVLIAREKTTTRNTPRRPAARRTGAISPLKVLGQRATSYARSGFARPMAARSSVIALDST